MSFLLDFWWTVVVVVVAVAEYRSGKKVGRRMGYVEGYRHGHEDAFRLLGVPVGRTGLDVPTVDEELSKLSRKGKPS